MKKAKKVILISISTIAILITIFLIVMAGFIIAWKIDIWNLKNETKDWTAVDFCESRWNITFPVDAEIVYDFTVKDKAGETRYNYIVCSFTSRPDEFLESFDKSTNAVEFYDEIVDNLTNNGIDTNYVATVTDTMIWSYQKKFPSFYLAIAYDDAKNFLYIAEKPFVR